MEQSTTILNEAKFVEILILLENFKILLNFRILFEMLDNFEILNFFEHFDFFLYIVWVLLNDRVTVISFIDFARECNIIFYCKEIAFC